MSVVHFKSSCEYLGAPVPELKPASIAVDESVIHLPAEVAASGSLTVDFGAVTTASVVIISGDRDYTYTLNSGSAVTVATKPRQVILIGTSVTALSIANSDASNVLKINIFLGGT